MGYEIQHTTRREKAARPREMDALAESPATNLVPGAEVLGWGFNIFSTYSFGNEIRPLFDLGASGSWTSPSSGMTYTLPANVSTPGGSSSSAKAQSFATSSQFNSYFSQSASVSGSIGAFSASFSESYSSDQQNSSSYSWALVEADYLAWSVSLDYSPAILLANITIDPDWNTLPLTFNPADPANVGAFFAFFQKFGTHFISSASVGGSLYYYFSISNSASYSSTQTTLSASAEYQGLISSVEAQADAHWAQCATNWTQNRQAHAVTVPATTGVIDWVNPLPGTYDQNGSFAQWKTSVLNNPSRTKFHLTPIWALFSGVQATALQLAFKAYANNRVAVQSSTGQQYPNISVNGNPMTPSGGFPSGQQDGWQLVVLDSKTLVPQLNRFFVVDMNQPNWPDPSYDAMTDALQPYAGSSDYMLVAATSAINDGATPTGAFYTLLKSFGAGAQLDRWMQTTHGCSGGFDAYALAGTGASSQGIEAFTSYNDPNPLPSVNVNALLLPLNGSFSPTPYQP